MTAKRILVVEDEKAIRDLIAFGLRRVERRYAMVR